MNTYTPSALMPNSRAVMIRRPVSARQACRTGVDVATKGQLSGSPERASGQALGLVSESVSGSTVGSPSTDRAWSSLMELIEPLATPAT